VTEILAEKEKGGRKHEREKEKLRRDLKRIREQGCLTTSTLDALRGSQGKEYQMVCSIKGKRENEDRKIKINGERSKNFKEAYGFCRFIQTFRTCRSKGWEEESRKGEKNLAGN